MLQEPDEGPFLTPGDGTEMLIRSDIIGTFHGAEARGEYLMPQGQSRL
jgi:hypothetical protein